MFRLLILGFLVHIAPLIGMIEKKGLAGLRVRAARLGVKPIFTEGRILQNRIDIFGCDKVRVLQLLFRQAAISGSIVGVSDKAISGRLVSNLSYLDAKKILIKAFSNSCCGHIARIAHRGIYINFKSNEIDVDAFNSINGAAAAQIALAPLIRSGSRK